jgi:threonine dehydrogenase-like Zn-dependent dehydrogenase
MDSEAVVMADPGTLERRTLEVPDPGPDEVLVEVELNGVCGTDVHMFGGGMDLGFPVLPGHEFAGRAVEVGENVETDSAGNAVAEGDAVTVVPGYNNAEDWYTRNLPTRPLACTDRSVYGFRPVEEYPAVHGGMSEYVLVEEPAYFYRLPDGLPTELGALVEPMSVATHAVERAYRPGVPGAREGLGPGQTVAVQGAGPIGQLTIAAADHVGAGTVVAVDMVDARLDLAGAFGATDTVDIEGLDDGEIADAVAERTPGGVGPDVVVEAVGHPTAFAQAIDIVRDAGTVVEVGHYADAGTVEVNPTDIVQKELDIHGSLAYPPTQFETGLATVADADKPFADLFNYRVGFDGADDAFAAQAEGEAYRATIHPGK